jgi:hypothetical protein
MMQAINQPGAGLGNRASSARLMPAVVPAAFAMFYPAFIDGFHWAVGKPDEAPTPPGLAIAAVMLLFMFAVPAFGFMRALTGPRSPAVDPAFETRSRRLAYATVISPTLYCFIGVWKYLLSSPLPDELAWAIIWGLAILYVVAAPVKEGTTAWSRPSPVLRVAHGLTALIIILFVAFHLTNHLFAWKGQTAHAAIMDMGRKIYRSPLGEPILASAMLFQVVTGLMLAWRWSAQRLDFYKSFQVASGFFLSIYILGHMNSVFVFARWFMGIPTGWDFATGAPNGLIHDPWSARLIPHYALATFLVIGHLFAGLRAVMLAHGASAIQANRIWAVGVTFAALLSMTIMLAMCGMRI